MKKKILLLLLAFFIGATQVNAYDFKVGELCYLIDYATAINVYVVFEGTGIDGDYGYSNLSGDIVIPSNVIYQDITRNVVAIYKHTFQDCTELTSVSVPNSVKQIGEHAFAGCSGLTSVSIGTQVNQIDGWAFYGCNNLKYLTWNAVNCRYGISNNTNTQNIEQVTIGDEVEILPNSFVAYSKITSVYIPNSVKTIGDCAFYSCSGLTTINIPNSVVTIGDAAFWGCNNLTSVIIPNSVISIGSGAFLGTSLTSVRIPNSVTSIHSLAFANCSELCSIIVDSGNPCYDSRNNCNAIIETASNTLISGCKNTTIPNTIASINRSAFAGCTGLTSISIPKSVKWIQEQAFQDCTGLTSIYSKIQNPQSVAYGMGIFNNVDNTSCKLFVPKGTKSLYQSTSPWSKFQDIIEVNYDNPGDVNGDGNVTAGDVTEVYNHLLNNDDTYGSFYDVNCDGVVTAADITALYDILLNN